MVPHDPVTAADGSSVASHVSHFTTCPFSITFFSQKKCMACELISGVSILRVKFGREYCEKHRKMKSIEVAEKVIQLDGAWLASWYSEVQSEEKRRKKAEQRVLESRAVNQTLDGV